MYREYPQAVACLLVHPHTECKERKMGVQFQNGFQNGLGLENRKMNKKHKQGKKMPPNLGPIAGPGSFSLGRR